MVQTCSFPSVRETDFTFVICRVRARFIVLIERRNGVISPLTIIQEYIDMVFYGRVCVLLVNG